MTSPRSERAFRIAFVLLAALTCLPIWTVELLPMVDLPQHEAQVSILRHWHDPACAYPATFAINWFTPYWLGYLAAYLLSWVFSVETAFRILICLILVATPWLTRLLIRDQGGDEWWALLCFPVGFGTTLSWGFYSFLAAVPLALLLLRAGFRYSRDPSTWRGLRLGLLVAGLFFAHVLVLFFTVAAIAAVIAAETQRWRELPRRLWPLLLSLPLPAVWLLRTTRLATVVDRSAVTNWRFQRVEELPVFLTGMANYRWAVAFSCALLLSLLLSGPVLSRQLARWLPFALTMGCLLFLPYFFLGTGLLYPRFMSFALPTLLVALELRPDGATALWQRGQIAMLAGLMLLLVQVRYAGIDREAAGLTGLLRETPAGKKLLYLDYDPWSAYSPDPVFLHYGSWYQVESCGRAEMSFAANFPSPVRFRAGQETTLPDGVDLAPDRFDWQAHGGASFDYFLIRAARQQPAERFGGRPGRVELVAHRERWWLYRNAPARAEGSATLERDPRPTNNEAGAAEDRRGKLLP